MRQHEYYKCPPECEGCQYCNGGLAFCTVCKQAEAELTKECPGPKEGMSKDTLIDEAKALKEKFENAALRFLEAYKPDYPYDQITVMADFADKIAADAVRAERERIAKLFRGDEDAICGPECPDCADTRLREEFAAELKEGE